MKQIIRIFAFASALFFVLAIFPVQISAQQNGVNFQEFYDQLSPYGQWIDNSSYGYVWIPDVGPGFTPYLTNGYWALTDFGWTWVSNYQWGWAPFHYGRWDFNDSYGWFWVPDNEWGPSWVTWRQSEGYYGWAPMRPGISVNISFGGHNDWSNDRWIFVRNRDIERHDIERGRINRENNITIINNSTVINKTYYDNSRRTTYVTGPGREDVQKITGRTIKPVSIKENNKPGQSLINNQLKIYRPQIVKNNNEKKPVPSKITEIKNIKNLPEKAINKEPINPKAVPIELHPPIRNDKNNKVQPPVINNANKQETKRTDIKTEKAEPVKKENKVVQPVQVQRPVAQRPVQVQRPVAQRPVQVQKPVVQRPVQIQKPVVQRPVQIQKPVVQRPVQVQKPVVQRPVQVQKNNNNTDKKKTQTEDPTRKNNSGSPFNSTPDNVKKLPGSRYNLLVSSM